MYATEAHPLPPTGTVWQRRGHENRPCGEYALIGLSAAHEWGMPLPPSVEFNNDVTAVSHTADVDSRPRGRSVDGHRVSLPAEHLSVLNGHCLTTPERTWVDCSVVLREEFLVAMGDWSLEQGLVSMESVHEVLLWAKGRRGVRKARHVAQFLRPGVESPQESRLRWALVSAGLPEPEINPSIVVHGHRVCRLDLAYTRLRLAVEYDGDWHADRLREDSERRRALARAGWAVVVARKEDLDHPGRIIGNVRALISQRQLERRPRW